MFLSPKNGREILLLAFAHILALFLQMSDCSLTQISVFICVTSVRLERPLWTKCWRNENPITALKGKPLIKQNLSWPWALVFYRFPQKFARRVTLLEQIFLHHILDLCQRHANRRSFDKFPAWNVFRRWKIPGNIWKWTKWHRFVLPIAITDWGWGWVSATLVISNRLGQRASGKVPETFFPCNFAVPSQVFSFNLRISFIDLQLNSVDWKLASHVLQQSMTVKPTFYQLLFNWLTIKLIFETSVNNLFDLYRFFLKTLCIDAALVGLKNHLILSLPDETPP